MILKRCDILTKTINFIRQVTAIKLVYMQNKKINTEKKSDSDGYPFYPVKEDIYNKSQKEENINPEDILKLKGLNEDDKSQIAKQRDSVKDESGNDLDLPGAELDDESEAIGNEDEENNYYSLGGDNHNDLDEDSV